MTLLRTNPRRSSRSHRREPKLGIGWVVYGLTLFVGLFLAADSALAHPFHVSLTQAEWNAASDRLEVALRLLPEDLEAALSDYSHRPVRLEVTQGVDDLLLAYLETTFLLHRGNQKGILHWVGKELSPQAAWLYFEVDLPGGDLAGWVLEPKMFLDREPQQMNTVQLKVGHHRRSLVFHRQHQAQTLLPDPAAAAPRKQP